MQQLKMLKMNVGVLIISPMILNKICALAKKPQIKQDMDI